MWIPEPRTVADPTIARSRTVTKEQVESKTRVLPAAPVTLEKISELNPSPQTVRLFSPVKPEGWEVIRYLPAGK